MKLEYPQRLLGPGAPRRPPPGRPARPITGPESVHDRLDRRARRGEIDPVLGRDAEIRQIIDILICRRQNNPILTGEAGVGKTAVARALPSNRRWDVPPPLQNVVVADLGPGPAASGGGRARRIREPAENR